jgi:hypothetical protein
MKLTGQLHAPASLPPRKEPQLPTRQEAEWGQNPILDTVGKRKISSFGRPARSLSQYWMSYPSSDEMMYEWKYRAKKTTETEMKRDQTCHMCNNEAHLATKEGGKPQPWQLQEYTR